MQYRTLGRTGIKVSPYALGALMFATSVGNPDPADSARIVGTALGAGINLIDTSDAYDDSEEVVGAASSRPTRSSAAASNARSCPSRSATAWACSCGARWPKGC